MDSHILIPITLFVCITYAFVYAVKAVVDARMRSHLAQSGTSEELLRSLLSGEEQQRRFAALRWGITLVAIAAGFAFVALFDLHDITPGVIAILAGAIGAGQLIFFVLASKTSNQTRA